MFQEGGPRPTTLLQRPAGGRTHDVAGASGARASDTAYADVRPPRGKRAIEELELRLLEMEAGGRMPTPAELEYLLRLAQAARAGDAAAGEGA